MKKMIGLIFLGIVLIVFVLYYQNHFNSDREEKIYVENFKGDNDSDKTRILGYGADEFAQMPLSPENVADKTFMLISRDTIKQNRLA